jgi:uncharacterized protein
VSIPVSSGMLKFFALTYSATWACFFAAAGVSSGPASTRGLSALHNGLLLLGTFAPALIALSLAWLDQGASGGRALLRPVLQTQAPVRWYLFAVGYLLGIKLAAALVHRVLVGSWPSFGTMPWALIAVAIVISTPLQAGEEIGWRGYALPRLANRFGLPRASLILGLVVACWHLPLFLVPGHPNYGQSFPAFVLGGIALSVAIAWLFVNSNGSVLLPMLMHSAVNQTNSVVPTRLAVAGNPLALDTSLITVLTVVLLWITAAYFLVRMPKMILRTDTEAIAIERMGSAP